MWKWDGKYQQVHAYTFTHRHAVRRLSCEYLQDGRLVYIFKTRSESHAALKSPLRALETHSGGLWKTHLFQKCHQSVSLDLWPVESKKKKSKYYRMWPVLPSRYLTWPHLLWSLCAPAGSPHLLKHTQQICLGWTLDPICSLRLLQWRLVSPIWPPSASASGINEEVMSLLSSSFGHSSTVTSHCLCSERVTEKENNYEWTDGIKPTAVIHNSAIYVHTRLSLTERRFRFSITNTQHNQRKKTGMLWKM